MREPVAKRRTVLWSLGGVAALGGAVSLELGWLNGNDDTSATERALARRLSDALDPSRQLIAFGRAYANSLPRRPFVGEVVRALFPPEQVREASRASHPRLRELARELVRTDVNVAGWLLSRSEALIAALVALSEPAGLRG
jgi:hypothetical protein